jgi:hypothetical protein
VFRCSGISTFQRFSVCPVDSSFLNSSPSTINSEPSTSRPRRLLWLAVLCLLSSVLCFACRAPLLRGIANAWIVNDPVAQADAIVILGGGLEYRPFEAARIYSNLVYKSAAISASRDDVSAFQRFSISAFSPAVLIAQSELPPTAQMGLTVPEFGLARQVLLTNGVPE